MRYVVERRSIDDSRGCCIGFRFMHMQIIYTLAFYSCCVWTMALSIIGPRCRGRFFQMWCSFFSPMHCSSNEHLLLKKKKRKKGRVKIFESVSSITIVKLLKGYLAIAGGFSIKSFLINWNILWQNNDNWLGEKRCRVSDGQMTWNTPLAETTLQVVG